MVDVRTAYVYMAREFTFIEQFNLNFIIFEITIIYYLFIYDDI